MSNTELYAAFRSVTQQDLIEYLPKLQNNTDNTVPAWYALMYKSKRVKRITACCLTAAFKELAIVNMFSTHINDLYANNTPIGYYYYAMHNNCDTIDQILCYKEMSEAEFFKRYNKDPNFVKKMILEWMIDECWENDIVHIERQGDVREDFSNSTLTPTKIVVKPIDVNKIVVEERQSSVVEKPPSFEEFMAELKSRASRKVKEYYRIIDDGKINLSHMNISEDLIFRGNIWQVLLDISNLVKGPCSFRSYDAAPPKGWKNTDSFLKCVYNYTNEWEDVDNEISSLDEFMKAVEEYARYESIINLRRLTMLKKRRTHRGAF